MFQQRALVLAQQRIPGVPGVRQISVVQMVGQTGQKRHGRVRAEDPAASTPLTATIAQCSAWFSAGSRMTRGKPGRVAPARGCAASSDTKGGKTTAGSCDRFTRQSGAQDRRQGWPERSRRRVEGSL